MATSPTAAVDPECAIPEAGIGLALLERHAIDPVHGSTPNRDSWAQAKMELIPWASLGQPSMLQKLAPRRAGQIVG